jgi:uncharacterized membrane protein
MPKVTLLILQTGILYLAMKITNVWQRLVSFDNLDWIKSHFYFIANIRKLAISIFVCLLVCLFVCLFVSRSRVFQLVLVALTGVEIFRQFIHPYTTAHQLPFLGLLLTSFVGALSNTYGFFQLLRYALRS